MAGFFIMSRKELKIPRLVELDNAQNKYHSWRELTHILETETPQIVLERLALEIKELEEAVKQPWKNRINIAGEAADIFIFSMALLDQNRTQVSSFSNFRR